MRCMKPEKQLQTIFVEALSHGSLEKREEYLERACQGNEVLLAKAKELLEAHEAAERFLVTAEDGTIDSQLPTNKMLSEGPGTVIQNYKLLQEIGEGGFGVVYMAEQREPIKRKVAFKVIKPGMDTRQVVARFEAERQALALMDHPNIARVLDAGTTDSGRPFFVMELVRGVPIIEFCDKNKLSTEARLKIFLDVCSAIQHAHQKGIIHRDLKPSNVLITLHDGQPVPKVIDFGIAKALNQELTEKSLFTAYGQMIGTPQYMSPEQAEMSGLDVDTRSDIYSLGVLLYELMTGRTPIDAHSLRKAGYDEMKRMIQEDEAHKPSLLISTMGDTATSVADHRQVDPRKLSENLRGDLDWIIMKALEKDRSRRYESAAAFAGDIGRHLNDEPVEAAAPSIFYLAKKYSRKHRRAFSVAAAIFLSLLFGVVGMGWLYTQSESDRKEAITAREEAQRQAEIAQAEKTRADAAREAEREQREQAESAQSKAEAAQSLAEQRQTEAETARTNEALARQQAVEEAERRRQELYSADMRLAAQFWENDAGSLASVDRLLSSHIPVGDQTDLRDFAWRHQWRNLHFSAEFTQQLQEDACAVFIGEGRLMTCDASNEVTTWDLKSGEAIRRQKLNFDEQIRFLQFSPDGKKIALITRGYRVHAYDTETGALISKWPGRPFATTGEFSPDSARFAMLVRKAPGLIRIWDPVSGEEEQIDFASGEPRLRMSAFSMAPDFQRAITISPRSPVTALIRTSDPEEPIKIKPEATSTLSAFAWSPSGEAVAIGNPNGQIFIYETESWELRQVIQAHRDFVGTLSFSEDGALLASGAGNGVIKVWDPHKGEQIHQFKGHTTSIIDIIFSPSGDQICSIASGPRMGSRGSRSLRVWNLETDHAGETLFSDRESIYRNAISPNGRWIAITQRPGKCRLIDAETGSVRDLEWTGRGIDFSPNSRTVAIPERGKVILADVDTGKEIGRLEVRAYVGSVAFSPDDRHLAVGRGNPFYNGQQGSEPALSIWDIETQSKIIELEADNWALSEVCYSPDGKTLVVSSHNGVVMIWETETWEMLHRLKTTGSSFISVAISPDGTQIAGGAVDGAIDLWNTKTGEHQITLEGHGSWVADLAYSPDGKTLASAGWDHTVKLWNPTTGFETRTLSGHNGWVNGVRFSPEGTSLISSSSDGSLKRWLAPTLETISRAPQTSESVFKIASHYRNRNEHTLAHRYFNLATELRATHLGAAHPKTLDSMRELAKSLEALNDSSVATDTWRKLIELQSLTRSGVDEPSFLEDLESLARTAIQQNAKLLEAGELTAATRELERNLQLVRSQPSAKENLLADMLNALGATQTNAGKHQEAAGAYREAVTLLSESQSEAPNKLNRAKEGLGIALDRLGETDEATVLFTEILESPATASSKVPARISLAKILANNETADTDEEAFDVLKSGLEDEITFEDRSRLVSELAVLARAQGETLQALAWDARAAATAGDLDQANHILNDLRQEQKENSQFEKLESSVLNEIIRTKVALLASEKDYAACLEPLQQLIAHEPENLTFKSQLALIHAHQGNQKAFFDLCEQLLDQSQHLESLADKARFAHIGLLLDNKESWRRTDEAIEICRKAFELDETNADLALYAALADMRAGRYEESAEKLNLAINSTPFPLGKALNWRAASVRSKLAGQQDRSSIAETMAMRNLQKLGPSEKINPKWPKFLICDLLRLEANNTLRKISEPVGPIPERPENLPSKLIDLSKHYNVSPNAGWPGVLAERAANPIAGLSSLHESRGIQFDYRGIIQLGGEPPRGRGVEYPKSAGPILVGQTCEKIHLLHAASQNADITGNLAGTLLIHYTDGSTESLELIVGDNSVDWLTETPQKRPTDPNTHFTFETQRPDGWFVKVLHTTWANPFPERQISNFRFISANEEAAPFLLAITLE